MNRAWRISAWPRTAIMALTASIAGIALATFYPLTRAQSLAAPDYAPSSSYVACAAGQLEYWSWDRYTRLWAHRCVNAGDKVLASEGDIVALPKSANLASG